jgi:O-methyltransferase involved in polyketide biosynthesis
MGKKKIALTKEMETLLVPLYCKAMETGATNPIIIDHKAIEILNTIEYNFDTLHIPKQTYVTICIRAHMFDTFTGQCIEENPHTTFIHLGCGLDSRFARVDNGTIEWYDLDFPQVITLRKIFYPESKRYHHISSPVMDLGWLSLIKKKKQPVAILAEGLTMYLKEKEVKELMRALHKTFPGSKFFFDSYSATTASHIQRHPSIKKTGAHVFWGINNAKKIESWDPHFKIVEELYFTNSKDVKKLDTGYKIIFKIAGLFPAAKKAHRIISMQL